MLSILVVLLAIAIPPSASFFLVPCWPISTQRLDPIIVPGKVSSHVHQIAGGGAFSPSMTYNLTRATDCTTCFVREDKSNYWIPRLYYQAIDGSFEGVNQVGSVSVYYLNEDSRLGAGESMRGFPAGLRIVAGNPYRRTEGVAFEDQAIRYTCLAYDGAPTHHSGFPDKRCPDGLRAEVTFPSCWDGIRLDSADHKSHMAYPMDNVEQGPCPPDHPVHLVTLKTEWIFDTPSYGHRWYGDSQPFVWSSGDPTGFGLHAEFLMGWDQDLLDRAVTDCKSPTGNLEDCPHFQGLLPAQKQYVSPHSCTVATFVDEDVGGPLQRLPGCNKVQSGPALASVQPCSDTVTLFSAVPTAA